MPHDHANLLARLREAKEGNRGLTEAMLLAAGWTRDDAFPNYWRDPHRLNVLVSSGAIPLLTTSLDAITREIEARMWTWMTSSTGKSFVIGDCLDPESAFYAECATPALSLCYAFVEALSHE